MSCGTPPCLPAPLPAYTMKEPAIRAMPSYTAQDPNLLHSTVQEHTMPPYTVKDPATPHFMLEMEDPRGRGKTYTTLAMLTSTHHAALCCAEPCHAPLRSTYTVQSLVMPLYAVQNLAIPLYGLPTHHAALCCAEPFHA